MAARGVTLAHTDFPLYTIRFLGDRHFLVAGGGGSAKTGVANAVDFFELRYESKSIVAKKVTHYEIESKAIMNCDVTRQEKHFCFASGQEDACHLYTLRYKVITPKVENEALEGLRKRKGNLTKSNVHRNASKMIGFEIEPGEDVKTDEAKDGGFQKVVRFLHGSCQMVTAGADGHFRVWKIPEIEQVYEVEAHKDEIDDLDVSPDNCQIVTVSRDSHAYLWNAAKGCKEHELEWKAPTQYRFRNCRYGVVADKPGELSLFTTAIPAKHDGKRKADCYIIKWDPSKGIATKAVRSGVEILSSLAVSCDGKYVAVGTISGSVSVYIAFSLQRLYHLSAAHSIFVTGLEFVPSDAPESVVGADVDFTLLSISCDNLVKVHQQSSRSLYNPLWALVGFLILLFLIYWVITALEL